MKKKGWITYWAVLITTPMILAAFILFIDREKKSAVTQPTLGKAAVHELTPAERWSGYAAAAEQAGQLEAASDYRARATAYLADHAKPAPGYPDAAGTLPQLQMQLYVRESRPERPAGAPLAKYEPVSGTYLGMLGADQRVRYDVTKIEEVYGRKHALYLSYVGWRKMQTDTDTYFPMRTADRVKAMGGALQIGWEPRYGLDDVRDDEYVRRFAREAKESGIPIFLRYASEMNGAWVPWHGDPQKYIEKFRLIHDIMAEEAPNVAMVWSPNFAPANHIDEYYPGDEYVDWVGFSLYSTPVTEGKEDLADNVIDAFAPLYDRYKHKPIMISEGAIAHSVLSTGKSYWSWAEGQLGYMYGFLPRMFPQVKAITYFNFSRAQASRSNMDYVYDLGENPYTDDLYKQLTASELYLSKVDTAADPWMYEYRPLQQSLLPAGKHTVMVYSKLADGQWPFAVALYQGDQRVGISYEMPWEMKVDIAPEQAGQPLRAVAYNLNMEPLAASDLRTAAAEK